MYTLYISRLPHFVAMHYATDENNYLYARIYIYITMDAFRAKKGQLPNIKKVVIMLWLTSVYTQPRMSERDMRNG